MQDRDTHIRLFGLLLHQSGDDDGLVILHPHRGIGFPHTEQREGGFTVRSDFLPGFFRNAGMNIHHDGPIFCNLGGHVENNSHINGHGLDDLSHRGLSGYGSGDKEDILISNPDDRFLIIQGGDGGAGEDLYISVLRDGLHDIREGHLRSSRTHRKDTSVGFDLEEPGGAGRRSGSGVSKQVAACSSWISCCPCLIGESPGQIDGPGETLDHLPVDSLLMLIRENDLEDLCLNGDLSLGAPFHHFEIGGNLI